MFYDLDTLESFSAELGFSTNRISGDELEIFIEPGVPLIFANQRNEDDTFIGFRGMYWHRHGNLMLQRRDGFYIEFDELDIVQNIRDGEILIYETYIEGNLRDRSLAHREERPDLAYIIPGEEVRIRRVLPSDRPYAESPNK